MKIYTCIDHDIKNPVGGASIIVAEDKRKARKLLNNKLQESGLKTGGFSLQEVDMSVPHAIILMDGEY